ncbi:hypothetical protein ABRQ82_001132 [Escherichia coli]
MFSKLAQSSIMAMF